MPYDPPIRYLARVFAPHSPSVLSSGIMKIATDKLGATAFNQFTANRLNPSDGSVRQANGIQTDAGWTILSVQSESADVEFHFSPGKSIDFADFTRGAGELLRCAFESQSPCTRLALVREGILPRTLNPEKMRDRLLQIPDSLAKAREWDWRAVQSVERSFGGSSETVNLLVNIQRRQGRFQGQAAELVRADFDINTSPENASPRFTGDDISAFLEAATEWHSTLESEFLTFAGATDG